MSAPCYPGNIGGKDRYDADRVLGRKLFLRTGSGAYPDRPGSISGPEGRGTLCMIRDFGNETEVVLEMWSRVKGDNLNSWIVILIFAVFGLLFVWVVYKRIIVINRKIDIDRLVAGIKRNDMEGIKNLIIDLGGVLINLTRNRCIEAFENLAWRISGNRSRITINIRTCLSD